MCHSKIIFVFAEDPLKYMAASKVSLKIPMVSDSQLGTPKVTDSQFGNP